MGNLLADKKLLEILFILLFYLIIVNAAGFILAAADKSKAIKGKRRVSEKSLFLAAGFGGAVGMYISMLIFRHKTKHKRFMIGIPLIIIVHIVIIVALYRYFLLPAGQ